MKHKFLILLVFVLLSCGKKIEFDNLVGSWKTQNVIDQSEQNASDKITFYSKDSIKIEIFANKKIVEKYSGKYSLDKTTKFITIQYPKLPKFEFEILKLSKDELILKNNQNKQTIVYSRY